MGANAEGNCPPCQRTLTLLSPIDEQRGGSINGPGLTSRGNLWEERRLSEPVGGGAVAAVEMRGIAHRALGVVLEHSRARGRGCPGCRLQRSTSSPALSSP